MSRYYDLLITTYITAAALPAVILLYHRARDKKSWEYRHKKLSLLFALSLLFGASVIGYGSFIEPNLLIVNKQTIDMPNIETPVTIAFFADPQVGPYKKESHIQRIVNIILKEQPDIVMMAGDYIFNDGTALDEMKYLKPLEQVAEKIPTYAVHGNHEYGIGNPAILDEAYYEINTRLPNLSEETRAAMEALGVHYLVNDLALVTTTPSSLYLFGADAWWAGKTDFSPLLDRDETNIPTIALIHNPAATWRMSDYDVDLMLAGHTHGGQIRLPFFGPMARVDNLIPREWYQGLHQYNNMQLYVTSGTGETGTRARLFNPPEVVILTIK